jgi:hypothetical protein
MPNSIITQLISRIVALEIRAESLITYQKWQMGLLAAIFVMSLGALIGLAVKR